MYMYVCNIYMYMYIHFLKENFMTNSKMASKMGKQWNLIIKRSDITKPSNNKVILLVPAIMSLFFLP